SQLGFMVYAIGTGGIFQSQFHLLSHSVFKALLFLGAGAVIHSVGTRDMKKMGGLSRAMPLTCGVFILGALALAGVPPVNGFWSKELLLDGGFLHGPLWAYIVMLATAGVTVLYTLRCVWLVFFAPPAAALHAHEAGPAMKTALIPLAIGSLLTWLLAGPFQALMARTLPLHFPGGEGAENGGTWGMVVEVVLSPSTWIALAVVALGVVVWLARRALGRVWGWLGPARRVAQAGFGFESINRGVMKATQGAGEGLRVTQSGLLNWNVAAIVMAVIAVLLAVILGG
ncbi:MAG TPA: proton-conducting transporter membrane subunit, partial [bacterium]|nr:proton-conducting transporter membrane subunit [bacterium]